MVREGILAWFRLAPKNGKQLFSMDFAQLEIRYNEAKHSSQHLFDPLWAAIGNYG